MSDAAAAKPVPNAVASAAHPAARVLMRRHRIRWWELIPWLAAIAYYFAFPHYLGFGSELLITVLFALSLDLALGYAGIITLGQAAFFGTGAYTVGMLAYYGIWTEPIGGLLCSRSGGRSHWLRFGPRPAAHQGAHTVDADALRHGAAGTGRQHGARHYGRFRRPEFYDLAGVRPVRIQSAVRQHPISLHARRPAWSASRSCARWSIRRSARA